VSREKKNRPRKAGSKKKIPWVGVGEKKEETSGTPSRSHERTRKLEGSRIKESFEEDTGRITAKKKGRLLQKREREESWLSSPRPEDG